MPDTWQLRLTDDGTRWIIQGPSDGKGWGSPLVTVLPYQHLGHAPNAADFLSAEILARKLYECIQDADDRAPAGEGASS